MAHDMALVCSPLDLRSNQDCRTMCFEKHENQVHVGLSVDVSVNVNVFIQRLIMGHDIRPMESSHRNNPGWQDAAGCCSGFQCSS